LKYPSREQWRADFSPIPAWVVVLIVVLLYGRLVMIALWHWVAG
jgi:uncharacterized membrane protein